MASEHAKLVRCAIYTRKSSEEGLEQAFNSLDAQREACLAYIESQRHEGWRPVLTLYNDGGYSGGNMERPALKQLLADIDTRRIDTVVVYKVDRLTRSLADFAKIVERFEAAGVSFVSVTQQFNTTTSMGRLTLNVLLSFAQFEREVTGERIRDKIAASKRKGMWMGGSVPLGYDRKDRQLVINPEEAEHVRLIFRLFLECKSVRNLESELNKRKIKRTVKSKSGRTSEERPYSRGALYSMLKSRVYRGEISHRDAVYPGQHEAIVPIELWEAVQALTVANNQAIRTGAYARDPSLLSGLLVDDRGNRLTPIHTTKRDKRYRYYASQAVIHGQTEKQGRVKRLPAHEVERQVTQRLERLLATGQELLDQVALPSDDAATHQALLDGAQAWKDLSQREPAQVRAFLLATLLQVKVEETSVQLTLHRPGLRTVLFRGGEIPQVALKSSVVGEEPDDVIQLSVTATIRRCGGGTRLIVPGESAGEHTPKHNAALIKAVTRAHHWYEQLLSGKVKSLHAIAREYGVTDRYVGHILRCAFLAPDLVEAILQGRQPPELTLDRLLENLPLDWAAQREALGPI
jgi:DNA invertase Pin-like site-specific DNA recombinase